MVEILIGRAQASHYRVSDPTVSRHHARLSYKSKDDLNLTDLGSRNGTYVLRKRDWVRLEATVPVRRTDQLRFGAAKVFVADIIADARMPDIDEAPAEESTGKGEVGMAVKARRELNRPKRNIMTGEVEES